VTGASTTIGEPAIVAAIISTLTGFSSIGHFMAALGSTCQTPETPVQGHANQAASNVH
jgi:hypothetical protein